MTLLRETIELLWSSYSWPGYSWHIALLVITAGLLLSITPHRTLIISGAAWILIGVNVAAALVYLILPQYYDHVEPHVVITALNAQRGLPLYPDWRRGEGVCPEV